MTSNNHPTPSRHQHRQCLTRPSRLLTVLLGLALVTSTAACSNEPVEYFTPPPATDTTVTPGELVEDEPEVLKRPDPRMIAQPIQPSTANELSENGARAFAYYFLEVLNYTAATGNTELLQTISGPECTACQGFIEATTTVEELNQWHLGFHSTYENEPVLLENEGAVFAFDINFHADKYETWNRDGLVKETESLVFNGAIVIYRLGNYWLVEEFGEMSRI
ncbi:DUF6318 family protein [Populibacterium corticicola]|uniref:DUF6318 family protein n=1 Tax=Populibacterium corticicola TaxID=1812826 RepID=A0ABW5XEA4_9MICO